MNKLKSAFSRHSSIHNNDQQQPHSTHHRQSTEETRSNAFFKKLEESKKLNGTSTALLSTTRRPAPNIDDLDTLSDAERAAYEGWWKDLNPFGVEKIDNKTILQFVSGCTLPEKKLEEILLLFEDEKEGLTKGQFFGMLRLIAHAENGRKVSLEMIYLGAPLPKFQTRAIDVLIKRSRTINTTEGRNNVPKNPRSLLDDDDINNVIPPTLSPISVSNATTTTMNHIPSSWIFPSPTNNNLVSSETKHSTLNAFAPANTNTVTDTTTSSPFIPQHSRSRSAPFNIISVVMGGESSANNESSSKNCNLLPSSTPLTIPTPSITSPYSVPIMNDEHRIETSTFNSNTHISTTTATSVKRRHHKNSISMGSDSLEEIMKKMDFNNNNQTEGSSSLLLTQGFKPNFLRDSNVSSDSDNITFLNDNGNSSHMMDEVETTSNQNNHFLTMSQQSTTQQQHYNPFARLCNNNNESIISLSSNISTNSSNGKNPFETDESSTNANTPVIVTSTAAGKGGSEISRSHIEPLTSLPPPPVPPQSTKPAYPKYARRT